MENKRKRELTLIQQVIKGKVEVLQGWVEFKWHHNLAGFYSSFSELTFFNV